MGPDWNSLKSGIARMGLDPAAIEKFEPLAGVKPGTRVLIYEDDPRKFLTAFFAAMRMDCAIFLGNPGWSRPSQQQALQIARPRLVVGNPPSGALDDYDAADTAPDNPAIMIPTGGTGGAVRFAIHTWETLSAAAKGFLDFFGEAPPNSCCVLPLFHVSGLMQVVRALHGEAKVEFLDLKTLPAGQASAFDPSDFSISVVPTQLRRLLAEPHTSAWLKKFRIVLLGGGPAEADLLEVARAEKIRLAPCYGTTETAAMVTALKPDQFLSGAKGVGSPLPHTRIFIRDEKGRPVEPGSRGAIAVESDSLSSGYYGEISFISGTAFVTGDEGYIDDEGRLHVLGRTDRIIISGGEKIDPGTIEDVLRATGLVADILIFAQPDPEWGQRIVALYVPNDPNADSEKLRQSARERLDPHQIPKKWIQVDQIPRNALGKIDLDSLPIE